MTDRYDDTLDRLAESLSMGTIDMRVLAVADPVGYLECRDIAFQFQPAIQKMVAVIEKFIEEARALGLCE